MDYLQNDVIIANPLDACSTLSNSAAVNGKIVLVEDGSLTAGSSCNYYKKVTEAQSAGAIAVIVYGKDTGESNWTDDLKVMTPAGGDVTAIKIPSIFIKAADGKKLKELIESEKTTVKLIKQSNVSTSGTKIVPGMFFVNDVVALCSGGMRDEYP